MRHRTRSRLLIVALAIGLGACQSEPTATPPPSANASAVPPSTAAPVAPSADPGATPGTTAGALAPTSADLIRADLDAGTIDRPTSILYRVYAVFGDPRLPAEYESDVTAEDGAALAAARIELDTFPAAIADELRPYLLRPTNPSSVFYDLHATAATTGAGLASVRLPAATTAGLAAPAAVVCNPTSGWGYGLGIANFKVWGECGNPADDADIQQVVAMVEGFWDAESAFLSREPLADDGEPVPDEWLNDGGGDSRIDIYLVNGCLVRAGRCRPLGVTSLGETLAVPPHTTVQRVGVRSSYVLMPKALLARAPLFRATVAHELFHVFQNSMNFDGLTDLGDYHWIVEASAKWAEWHFSQVAENVTPWFEDFQVTNRGLAELQDGNPYSSFTWPLFLEEEAGGPGAIATLWQSLEGKAHFVAVNTAIDRVHPFKDHFREFAIRNWNTELGVGDPMDPLHPVPPTSRSQPHGDHSWAVTELTPHERGRKYRLGEYVSSLYAKYAPFTVDQDVGQIVLDLSGLPNQDRFDADVLVKVKDQGWERRKLKKGTTTWCTDNPDDDIEEFVVVISNHDDRGLGVSGTWTVEALPDPCLSYSIHIDYTEVYDGIADAFKFDGFADQVDPNASGGGVWTINGTGTMSGSRPGWAHCNPGIGTVPSGSGPAIFVASISGDIVSIGAFPDLASTGWGVSTQPFSMDRKGGTLTIRSDGTVGDLCPRSWFGSIKAEVRLKEPLGNAEGD